MQFTAIEPQRTTSPAPVQPSAPPQGPQPLDPQALAQVSGGGKGGKPIGTDGWSWG
jgi:hypothetical protein